MTETCESCGKPLGNSADGRCHECGGETYRAGGSDTGAFWRRWWNIELGIRFRGDDE